jgi:polysaccharide export outer membrane protein
MTPSKVFPVIAFLLFCVASTAQENPGANDYRIGPMDEVLISVFGEPELTVTRRLDADGRVSLPLLGDTRISGHTTRSAEDFLEKRFIEEEYLISPQVTVSIVQYNTRQFYIFGQVQSPGAKLFPIEVESLDIIDAISRAGDFTDLAKRNGVRVTRTDESGREEILVWNLEGLIQGSGSSKKNREKFRVYPGDIIFVPERVF